MHGTYFGVECYQNSAKVPSFSIVDTLFSSGKSLFGIFVEGSDGYVPLVKTLLKNWSVLPILKVISIVKHSFLISEILKNL